MSCIHIGIIDIYESSNFSDCLKCLCFVFISMNYPYGKEMPRLVNRCVVKSNTEGLSNVLFVYIYYYIMQYGPEGELTLKQKSHILKADHIASKKCNAYVFSDCLYNILRLI